MLTTLSLLLPVTLKNAAELLEFAAIYNADQLKLSCLQFIVLNMAALLESKWESLRPLSFVCGCTGSMLTTSTECCDESPPVFAWRLSSVFSVTLCPWRFRHSAVQIRKELKIFHPRCVSVCSQSAGQSKWWSACGAFCILQKDGESPTGNMTSSCADLSDSVCSLIVLFPAKGGTWFLLNICPFGTGCGPSTNKATGQNSLEFHVSLQP